MSPPLANRINRTPGGVSMCMLSTAGRLSAPQLLAPQKNAVVSGFPRAVAVDGARFLLNYTHDGEASRIATQLMTL